MSRLLKRVLSNVLTPKELEDFIAAFDVIGDIAIIKVPDSIRAKAGLIAEALLTSLKYVKSVYRQSTPVSGRFRVRGLEHIAGDRRTLTLYKEYGCQYRVDVAKVFFSPRLSTERSRIADLVTDGEVVVNLFAGVGPFSILIAKRKRNVLVHSIEANPEAYNLMVENISLNKVGGKVLPYLGDTNDVVWKIPEIANKVLMPHPEESEHFLEAALKCLKPDTGVIHYYTFSRRTLQEEALLLQEKTPFESKILGYRKVREIGSGLYEVVVDLQVVKGNK